MGTERDKMLAGELYDALDPELVSARYRVRDLCQKLNGSRDADENLRRDLCRQIFGKGGETVWMQPPFYCDYGSNIELGERVFFNFNCIVLDVCRVRIGDYTLFGPAVQVLTPMHPLDAALRRKQEYGKPVDIGSDVWVGGWGIDPPRCHYRIGNGDRCWQRGHPRCHRWSVCGGQPLSRHSGDQPRGAVVLSDALITSAFHPNRALSG